MLLFYNMQFVVLIKCLLLTKYFVFITVPSSAGITGTQFLQNKKRAIFIKKLT